MDGCESIFVDKEGKYLHIRRNIYDEIGGDQIGKVCYTIKILEDKLEVLGLDITMDNDTPSLLRFNKRYDNSSDSNEYYEVEMVEVGAHLQIETVNRHVVREDLIDTEREVFVSAFPFELNIFPDIDALNDKLGFKPVKIKGIDIMCHGLSDKFAAPAGALSDSEEKYSFVVGTVVSFRDAEIAFGDVRLPFVLAKVDTALGVIPVVMGREVFDIAEIKEGCIVGMNADIKVDLATDEDFQYPKANI